MRIKNQMQLFWKGLNSGCLVLYTAVYIFSMSWRENQATCFNAHRLAKKIFVENSQEIISLIFLFKSSKV